MSSAILNDLVPQVVLALQDAIAKRKVQVTPMSLIAKGMEYVERYSQLTGKEKRDILLASLEKLAAGEDGVAGTADDLVPKAIVDGIKAMIANNLVEDAVNMVADVSKGKYDLNQVLAVTSKAAPLVSLIKGCLQAMPKSRRSKYQKP